MTVRRHDFWTGPDWVHHVQGAVDTPQIEDPNANVIVKFAAPITAVTANQITVTSAAANGAPNIAASGSDTNIDVTHAAKGTGSVRLGQATSLGVVLVADQPLNDSSGNAYLKFSKAATAVNFVQVANAATLTQPSLTATGTDTNVSIVLAGKGTGVVRQAAPVVQAAAVTAIGSAAGQTLTIAQLLTALITHTPTGAVNDTLPTAALAVAGIPGVAVNDRIYFDITNLHATNVITIVAGSGGALTAGATATIAGVTTRFFALEFTNVTPSSEAYVVYSLGAGTN